MNKLTEIIKTNSYKNIDSIDNINISNIDTNIDIGRYALKNYFEPRTEETSTAKEIASYLNDNKNFALYRFDVQNIGSSEAYRLLKETKNDVLAGERRGKPIRNPAALYNWKVTRLLKKKEGI